MRAGTSHVLLAAGMLAAGTCNTITCKATFNTVALGRPFNHPFVMALFMFLGEATCLVAWWTARWMRGGGHGQRSKSTYSPIIFILPALCDVVGTSIVYWGLTLTTASDYQMLRGSVYLPYCIVVLLVLRTLV